MYIGKQTEEKKERNKRKYVQIYELQSPNVRFHRMYLSSVEGETLGRIFLNDCTKSSRETGRIRLTDSFFNSSIRNSRTGPIAASFAKAVKSLPE